MIERRREPKPVTVEKILPEDREESDAEEKTAEISGRLIPEKYLQTIKKKIYIKTR